MKYFDSWLAQQDPVEDTRPILDDFDEWPDMGVWKVGSRFYTHCCRCGKADELEIDSIDDIPPDGSYQHHCGGSPWCCP